MKGIQRALGTENKNMKGLQMFIHDIRNCPSKEQESKRVEKELAKIRQKFTATKLSGYDKKKYVWKLLYSYMLGYDIDFGHLQSVELCSSQKFSEKSAGYLAMSLLLADETDILRLVVNNVKTDMNSGNDYVAALALNTVANIGSTEFADNLFADISKILLAQSQQFSSYIKRKACICLLRLYRKDNDMLEPDVWKKKLAAMFHDRDIGLLTSVSGFFLAILEMGTHPAIEWSELIPAILTCLNHLVQNECPEHYQYYHVPAPWLQTKLLRILQFFPLQAFDADKLQHINSIFHTMLTKPATYRALPANTGGKKTRGKEDAERQNRSNAEHAILFEAMNLMIHLEDRANPETMRTASGLLGAFLSSPDANIRYLGLETMARLATNMDSFEHLERYKSLILEKMNEADISIRRQALNLLYALCRPENWRQIVDELLVLLGNVDQLLQQELVLKIAILAEKNAPNFKWYVDVVFRMLESAPDSVGDDVWYRVVQVVTGFSDGQSNDEKNALQKHAATRSFQNLSAQFPHETLVRLGVYMIGEFGHLLPDNEISPRMKFETLNKHFGRVSGECKAILVMAMVKLLNANPEDLKPLVLGFLEEIQDQQDVELQQRACELMHLIRDEDMLEKVLAMMPVYAETIQQNNPLVQRLKFQNKSRAATRAMLEEAAKSEGGMYKQGANTTGRSGLMNSLDASMGNQLALGNNRDSGSESDSGSGSGSDSDEDKGKSGAQDPRILWQNLCIMQEGPLFASKNFCLEMKQEYISGNGRLTILFRNSSSSDSVNNIRVHIPEVPFMRIHQANAAPTALAPGQQQPHFVQVQCVRPFLRSSKYLVEYVVGNGKVVQLPLMLPAVMTKFMEPCPMQQAPFRQYFESLTGPGQEMTQVGPAKVPPQQWPNYLGKGFNMHVLPESNQATLMAAGTLQTVTPDPGQPGKTMQIPCMVKFDFNPQQQITRITVKTANGEVTSNLMKIIEVYFLVQAKS